MIQSSLSSFASQFKADSGSKGDFSQDRAQEISLDQDPSPEQVGQVDQVDPPEGEEGELLAFEEEDPKLHQGDPNLTQLPVAAPSVQSKKGKPHCGRFPRESFVPKLSRLNTKLICLILARPSLYNLRLRPRLQFKRKVRLAFNISHLSESKRKLSLKLKLSLR